MLTNIAIAMSLTLIIITIQCFLLWTFAIQRFRDTTQFECSRQNIVLLVYQNNQFSFACFPFSVALNNWLHQHDTRIHERFWSHTIGCHWTCHFQPTSRSLLGHKGPHKVTSLHGDLSDQRKVKTDTLVAIELNAVANFSGCGLPSGQRNLHESDQRNQLEQPMESVNLHRNAK